MLNIGAKADQTVFFKCENLYTLKHCKLLEECRVSCINSTTCAHAHELFDRSLGATTTYYAVGNGFNLVATMLTLPIWLSKSV